MQEQIEWVDALHGALRWLLDDFGDAGALKGANDVPYDSANHAIHVIEAYERANGKRPPLQPANQTPKLTTKADLRTWVKGLLAQHVFIEDESEARIVITSDQDGGYILDLEADRGIVVERWLCHTTDIQQAEVASDLLAETLTECEVSVITDWP